MRCVSGRGKVFQFIFMIAVGLILASGSALAGEGDHKLFINKKDLNRLNIKESAGSYNYYEEKKDLLSHYSDPYKFQNETQIKPGWFARCGGDFSLSNTGPGTAEFQVVLDGSHVHHESLGNGGSRNYIVKHHEGPTQSVGVAPNFSDVGVVLNYSESAVLKMTCN